MKSLVMLATGIGLGGSAAATYRAHRKPMSPEWDDPVGDTRLRRSDLPIGGAVAMALALGSLVTGHRKAAAVFAGAGLGATAGSLGVGLMEPLPETKPAADDLATDPTWRVAQPQPGSGADQVSEDAAVTEKEEANEAAANEHAGVGRAAGADVPTAGTVTMPGVTGAASATLADADDALGGISTDTADWLAAEARAKASLPSHEQQPDEAPDSGVADEQPPASASEPAQTPDVGDDEEAEHQLEQAEVAVEHQAFYGSQSADEIPPESIDESASEPVVTGSAPQEGQLPGQE